MRTSQIIEILQNHPIFAILSESELIQLAERSERLTFKRYDFLFMPDEKSNTAYLCLKGRVKVGSFNESGKQIIKAIVPPGELLGEMALFHETLRDEYAHASFEDVVVLEMPVEVIRHLMQRNAQFTLSLLQHFNRRLREVEERLVDFVLKDARQRVVDFLVQIARSNGSKVGFEMLVKHRYTQQDIAGLTGASRQTVTKVLNDLRRDNLIKFSRRHILIKDMSILN